MKTACTIFAVLLDYNGATPGNMVSIQHVRKTRRACRPLQAHTAMNPRIILIALLVCWPFLAAATPCLAYEDEYALSACVSADENPGLDEATLKALLLVKAKAQVIEGLLDFSYTAQAFHQELDKLTITEQAGALEFLSPGQTYYINGDKPGVYCVKISGKVDAKARDHCRVQNLVLENLCLDVADKPIRDVRRLAAELGLRTLLTPYNQSLAMASLPRDESLVHGMSHTNERLNPDTGRYCLRFIARVAPLEAALYRPDMQPGDSDGQGAALASTDEGAPKKKKEFMAREADKSWVLDPGGLEPGQAAPEFGAKVVAMNTPLGMGLGLNGVDEGLAEFPGNGLAHYELGLTMREEYGLDPDEDNGDLTLLELYYVNYRHQPLVLEMTRGEKKVTARLSMGGITSQPFDLANGPAPQHMRLVKEREGVKVFFNGRYQFTLAPQGRALDYILVSLRGQNRLLGMSLKNLSDTMDNAPGKGNSTDTAQPAANATGTGHAQ